LNYDFELDIDW